MPPGRSADPDVTVVVIVYNDAARLGRAVRSVLRQTHRNLEVIVADDASSDGTPEVSRRLVDSDPRVRAIRLPVNSGGCSGPRNAGMEQARGRYLMFLDSDDVYPRRAVALLLSAIRGTGADMAAGLAVRDFRTTGRVAPWYPRLYDREMVYSSIREHPQQLHDTISVNKIYDRRFLDRHALRFAEGVLYEDQLFTAQAYCLAERMAVVPRLVYRWIIAGDPENLSITNRRHELENFGHRLEVNRRIDAFLADRGLTDLQTAKDHKFLTHDLQLYLEDLSAHDEAHQREFLKLAGPYVETLEPRALARGSWIERITWHYVVRQDLAGTLGALDQLRHGKLSVPLVAAGGRVWWAEPGCDDEAGELLDVTEVDELDVGAPPLHSAASAVCWSGPTVLRLVGRTLNQLGRIPDGDEVSVDVLLRRDGVPREVVVPVTGLARRGGALSWTADLDLAELLPSRADRSVRWTVSVRTAWRDVTEVSPLSVDERVLSPCSPASAVGLTATATKRCDLVLEPCGRPAFALPRLVTEARRRAARAYQVARNTALLTARPAVLELRTLRRRVGWPGTADRAEPAATGRK